MLHIHDVHIKLKQLKNDQYFSNNMRKADT